MFDISPEVIVIDKDPGFFPRFTPLGGFYMDNFGLDNISILQVNGLVGVGIDNNMAEGAVAPGCRIIKG